MTLPVSLVVDIASGILLAAVGALVLLLRPASPTTRALGLVLVTYGLSFVGLNLMAVLPPGAPESYAIALATLSMGFAAAWGLTRLTKAIPSPASREAWRRLRWWRATGILAASLSLASSTFVAVNAFGDLSERIVQLGYLPAQAIPYLITNAGLTIAVAFIWYAGIVFAGRASHAGGDATPQLALATLSLVSYPALNWGANGDGTPYSFLGPIAPLPVAAAWLVTAHVSRKRLPRTIAWVVLACILAGMTGTALMGKGAFISSGIGGITRTLGLLVLAYAILRHRLLGLDVKVRWTISKSTIAAVFIAAFFVASEAAQQFFGETLESTYLGIAAAGMLVFAMAPLQRAAERLAERAVPIGSKSKPGAPDPDEPRVAAYRAAVRAALRDGGVTRREEIHLAEVAHHLGLSGPDAARLRHEVEDDPTTHAAQESIR